MNCQFCYTGRMGLRGNLSTAQIVEQVLQNIVLLQSTVRTHPGMFAVLATPKL